MNFTLVAMAIRQIHQQRQQNNLTTRERPTVVLDAHGLGYATRLPVITVAMISSSFCKVGVDAVIVFDSDRRHDSKRACHQRLASKDKDKIHLIEERCKLAPLINDCSLEASAAAAASAKKIKSIENRNRVSLPLGFVRLVEEHATHACATLAGNVSFITAPFQADPCMAKIAMEMKSDAIISGDSDFAMYIGPGLDIKADIMLRNIKLDRAQSKIESCVFVTGQESTAAFLENAVGKQSIGGLLFPPSAKPTAVPPHPFFGGVANAQV